MYRKIFRSIVIVLVLGLCGSIAVAQDNQIVNGEFDDDLNSWNLYGGAGFTVEVVQGAGLSGSNAVMIDVTDASVASIGISQIGLVIEPGITYPIGFRARAEEDREMVVLLQGHVQDSWPDYLTEIVELTTTTQDYLIEYTHTGDTIGDEAGETLYFYLMLKGAYWPMTGNDLNKKVWIDQVYFGAETIPQLVGLASDPSPEDGALHLKDWVAFEWTAGDFAVSHNVYMGDNFDDVNDGLGDTFRVNKPTVNYYAGFPNSPYPDGLVPGTTYYWRIDEVNDADPNSPWKGEVWSFTVPSIIAYAPSPPDGDKFINLDVVLSWMPGLDAALHTVHFGDNFDDVNNATTVELQSATTYTPGTLEHETTYYWRVDEFVDGETTNTGDVWSFTTQPEIPITDPNLMGWWSFDEGSRSVAVDWSGHDNHGGLIGEPQWVAGYDGGALELDGSSWVDCGNSATLQITGPITIACWINPTALGGDQGFVALNGSYVFKVSDFLGSEDHLRFTTPGITDHDAYNATLENGEWQHVAITFDPNQTAGAVFYINGAEADRLDSSTMTAGSEPFLIGNNQFGETLTGLIDEVRVYNKVLTAEEITQAMRGDPLVAWSPNPANGSTPDIDEVLPLTWSPGDMVSQHDVYFGTDMDAVANADESDTTGIYRSRQSGTSYTPPEGVELGGGPYYWRIDEYNTDGSINKGKIWRFTVADHILVDDFEDYDVGNKEIWWFWKDGLGYGAHGNEPASSGNGTGSAVGDDFSTSYMEETIVNGGRQSMPVVYDNNKQNYLYYSEVELTLTDPRDWTKNGVAELSLWFRGRPGSVGSFVENPVGTYTMTGAGADIWGNSDEFHFAFKTLSGDGSIVAKVQSIENTWSWAKAGVMIRETLDADSAHAMMVVTPTQGVSFQRRNVTGDISVDDTTGGITAPYWVKIERDVVGNFIAYSSTNGSTWDMQGLPDNISMGSNVYIGLIVCSTNAPLTCRAVLSNVTTTGLVGQQWANQDIGIASNAPEPLYVAVSNSAGTAAVEIHDDPAAATIDTWTEWVIQLQDLADKGLILTDVDSIAIGLGTKDNMTVPGGSGKIYIDDIRLYRTREAAE